MEPVEVIDLDDTHRIVVEYDYSPESPRDWQEGISVYPLNLGRNYSAPDPGTDSHGYAIDVIIENLPHDQVEAAITKHFQRAGLPFVVREQMSDRDYVGEFLWYLEPSLIEENEKLDPGWTEKHGLDLLKGCAEAYQQWGNGEVYGVSIQERARWVKVEQPIGQPVDDPAEYDTWETIESCWGFYLNDRADLIDAVTGLIDDEDLIEKLREQA